MGHDVYVLYVKWNILKLIHIIQIYFYLKTEIIS